MKRDMDLIREILLALEDLGTDSSWPRTDFEVPGYPKDVVLFHVRLLAEAGFVRATRYEGLASPPDGTYPISLTWAGCEFLDAARNDTLWAKAKSQMIEKGGGVVVDVLKELLVQMVRRNVLPGS